MAMTKREKAQLMSLRKRGRNLAATARTLAEDVNKVLTAQMRKS